MESAGFIRHKSDPHRGLPGGSGKLGDAQAFCQWLTDKERAAKLIGQNQRYRLPTDSEWSKAVGLPEEVGSTPSEKSMEIKNVYPWGNQWPPPKGAGNYSDTSDKTRAKNWPVIDGYDDGFTATAPVGSFAPNWHGLFDLGGNVSEWCEDWFDDDEESRVVRGASWMSGQPDDLLSSNRDDSKPDKPNYAIGFRVVLAVEKSSR